MAGGMRLDIEPPRVGWAMVRLTAPGVRLEFAASYTPWDSIGALAHATAGLLAGLPEQVVNWNTEPREYEFRFTTAEQRTRLEVCQYPDTRRRRTAKVPVVAIEGDALGIATAVWRGLRRLQGAQSAEAFAEAWGHPYPSEIVERMGQRLRAEGQL